VLAARRRMQACSPRELELQSRRRGAKEKNIPVNIYHLKTQEDGHRMPIPWVINSVFYKGKLVSLEMKVDKHLDKLI